jgi:putative endonuclease
MPQTEKQKTGKWGEDIAASFLVDKGYEIIETNFSIHKKGEIDIIAWHEKKYFGKTLCFVEIKTRGTSDGSAERSVGKKKLQSLFFAANMYCNWNDINVDRTAIQFEQVSIYFQNGKMDIRHYEIPMG